MKLVTFEELSAIKTPVVFAWVDPDEENISGLYYKLPDLEGKAVGRSVMAVSLITSTDEQAGIDNYYEMLEGFQEGVVIEHEWGENVDNSEHAINLTFTEDVMYLLYSKQDIQRMAAALAGIWAEM